MEIFDIYLKHMLLFKMNLVYKKLRETKWFPLKYTININCIFIQS